MDKTKKIILISVLGIILVTLTSVVIVRQVRKRRGRLNGGEDSVPVKNSNPKTILIVGDSQSAIKNAKGGNITYSYPNILKEKLDFVKC